MVPFSEGIFAEGSQAGRKRNLGDFAAIEGAVSDVGHAFRDRHRGQTMTGFKREFTDGPDGIRDGIAAFHTRGAVEQNRPVLRKQNAAFVAAVSGIVRCDENPFLYVRKRKGIPSNGTHACRDFEAVQTHASCKRVVSDGGDALGDFETAQTRADHKRVVSDGGDALGDFDTVQIFAAEESAGADGAQSLRQGNLQDSQGIIVPGRIIIIRLLRIRLGDLAIIRHRAAAFDDQGTGFLIEAPGQIVAFGSAFIAHRLFPRQAGFVLGFGGLGRDRRRFRFDHRGVSGDGLTVLQQPAPRPKAAAHQGKGQHARQEPGPQTVEKGPACRHSGNGDGGRRGFQNGSGRRSGSGTRRAACRRGFGKNGGQGLFLCRPGGLQPSHQSGEEGDRAQPVELHALALQRPDLRLHLFPALKELGLDGAGGHAKGLGDLPDAHIFIIPHADDELLLLRQLGQDLPYQPGRLLPVQGQLRLDRRIGIGQFEPRLVRAVPQLREAGRLSPCHLPNRLVHSDPPQPGQEGFVGLQLIQAPKGPEPTVLQHVPGQVLVPDHGPDRAVEGGIDLLVKGRAGCLIAASGPFHQLRGDFCPTEAPILVFHASHLLSFLL